MRPEEREHQIAHRYQTEATAFHLANCAHECFFPCHSLFRRIRVLDSILCSYGYMIDNVILLLTGTLHERDTRELLEKCHPLGKFQSLATLAITTNPKDAYKLVLVDTPLAPYAQKNFSESQDFTELNIEIIRNTLYKAYLEDFYAYTQSLGGATAEVSLYLLSLCASLFLQSIFLHIFHSLLSSEEGDKNQCCAFFQESCALQCPVTVLSVKTIWLLLGSVP
jgi:hypothetical protein